MEEGYGREYQIPKRTVLARSDGAQKRKHSVNLTTIPKLINYIGSSASHKDLMRGQILPLDKGVTGEAFNLAEEEPPKVN